eukprot:gene8021-biopygen19606
MVAAAAGSARAKSPAAPGVGPGSGIGHPAALPPGRKRPLEQIQTDAKRHKSRDPRGPAVDRTQHPPRQGVCQYASNTLWYARVAVSLAMLG